MQAEEQLKPAIDVTAAVICLEGLSEKQKVDKIVFVDIKS